MSNPTKDERGVHIMLVDDNQIFLKATEELLRRTKGLAIVATVNDEGKALPQAQRLRPHVVLIGLDRPELGGLRAISCLRTALPEVTIIALTMLDGEAYRRAALLAGADEVVTKVDAANTLLPAIRRAV